MKKLVAIMLVLALVLSLSIGFAESITLNVLNWGNSEEEAVFKDAIARFNEKYPDVVVEHTIVPVESWSDFIQKWVTMIGSSNAPDLTNIAIEGFQMAVANDLVMPLDDVISGDADMSAQLPEFAQSLLDGFSYDGKLYGIPNGTQTMVVYYNKALFDAKGLAYPQDGWTWEQFRQTAIALTDGDVYGWGLPISNWHMAPFWITNGAYPCSADYSAPTLNTPEMVEALTFLSNLVLVDKCAPDPTGVDVYAQFAAGKIAMVGAGRWTLASWLKEGFDTFDCVSWPMNKVQISVYGGAAWTVNPNTQHKAEAIALLKEFTSAATLSATAKLGQQIPPMASLATDPAIMGNMPENIGQKLWNTITTSKPIAAPMFFGQLEKALVRAVENTFAGVMTAQEALDQAQQEVEAELN